MFTRTELELLAEYVKRFDAYALCDEVYEHIVFDRRQHVTLMSLPGMRERCLKIGSAGKTFSLTGWKVGYITAPAALLAPVSRCHQFLVFTTPPNLQRAVAYGLDKDDSYFTGLTDGMRVKRDRLATGLARIGFDLLDCEGPYFINAGFRRLGFNGDDMAFCRHITTEAGVTAIPVNAFYAGGAAPATIARPRPDRRRDVLAGLCPPLQTSSSARQAVLSRLAGGSALLQGRKSSACKDRSGDW